MRFIKRAINAMRWNRSLDLVERSDLAGALNQLDRMDVRNLGVLAPDIALLKSWLFFRTENTDFEVQLAETMTQIQGATYLSKPDKLYMLKYAEWILARHYGLKDASISKYSEFQLKDVSNRLKEIFPLLQHPEWKV